MKVEELIEYLKKYDQHKEVWILSPDDNDQDFYIKEVEEDGDRNVVLIAYREDE